MTAQVAVMNTLGVALAADSAVTTTYEYGEKIYASSDKLFQLSGNTPVAIMFSGNSDFLDVPWETVIKMYKNQLGNKTFAKLSDYTVDFFRFVRTNKKMFPLTMQNKFVEQLVDALLGDVWRPSHARWKEIDAPKSSVNESMPPIIHEVVAEKLKNEKSCDRIAGFGLADDRTVQAKYKALIAKKRKEFFKKEPLPIKMLPAKTCRALDDLILTSISRDNFRSMETEIVFAGFGEDEYTPSYFSFDVEGMVRNKLRYYCADTEQITSSQLGWIQPFGQSDVVDTFTDGVSAEFRSYMAGGIDEFVEKAAGAFERVSGREYTDREAKKIATTLRKEWDDLNKKWDAGERKSWWPIFRTVASLPKLELADAAENFVNLTKFYRRVNPGSETVGGPIDVAFITKGEGFVWIKKKQYYPLELNPHKTDGSIGN